MINHKCIYITSQTLEDRYGHASDVTFKFAQRFSSYESKVLIRNV